MNPTANDECGLLVAGFDSPPVLMMTYNPPYYADQMAAAGLQKAKDLLAFMLDLKKTPMRRFERIAEEFGKRQPDIRVRPLRRKTLFHDLLKVKEVYNSAWEENWGFVPMTDPEIDFMAKRLKPLLMEGLIWLAETATEPVGFLLAMPDYNQAIQPLKGKLLTPKLIGFLPYLLGRKWPKQVRLIAFGIKKEYRKRGIESAMLAEGLRFGFKAGFQTCEASWILEDNLGIQRIIGLFGGTLYKTYRIYQRDL
jgi:ribosomal protein S18 acetylase RimI-like enzyme